MLKTSIKAAVVQMSSSEDVDANVEKASFLIDQATKKEAQLVLLPECFVYRGKNVFLAAQSLDGEIVQKMCLVAKQKKIWLFLGSVYEKVRGSRKVYNTAVLIGPKGNVIGTYRKQHLFEANLSGHKIHEADVFLAGKKQPVFKVGAFSVGVAICYDLRFSKVFSLYARQGAEMFFVPSNFTHETGKDHWEILLRARAIENRCYVLAPNQYGTGASGVKAYGNSMIIDPWGRVLERAHKKGDAVLVALVDKKKIAEVRKRLPQKER